MILSLIVAISDNNALGKDNQLLWHLSSDLKRFKQITTGHPIIMGRKTYESIGKPLPNRTNIIITNQTDYQLEGCIIVNSIEEAIVEAKKVEENEAFIIGGGTIYQQSMALIDKLYLTQVHQEFKADTFFPVMDLTQWQLILTESHQDTDPAHTFSIYQK